MITETKIGNERVLGTMQQTGEIHLRPTWCLNGNNLAPARDAYRRWLICNIVTELENPEERKVEREDLLDQVHKHRETLLRDALIVLKAHAVAGYPKGDWAPLGSFYEWDKIVRGAVWFATDKTATGPGKRPRTNRPNASANSPSSKPSKNPNHVHRRRPTVQERGHHQRHPRPDVGNRRTHDGKPKYLYQNLRTAVTAFPVKSRETLQQSLGSTIAGLKNKTLDGKRLIKNGESHKSAIWLVIRPQK